MISGMSVLGLVTARGGSKGLPGKNVLPLAGLPLIGWTIKAARSSKYLDRTILSTDCAEIASVARSLDCEVPFLRPAHLATDTATSVEVAIDALDRVDQYDWLVLLQPTSPLRTAEDIDAAIESCVAHGASSCVSVSEVEKSPFWMYRVEKDQTLSPVLEDRSGATRRQDLPAIYVINGGVYVIKTSTLRETRCFAPDGAIAYIMPKERAVDIDSKLDLMVAEELMRGTVA